MEERALCAGMTYEVWGGEAWGGGRFVQDGGRWMCADFETD